MIGFSTTCDQTCDRTHLTQFEEFCFEVFVFAFTSQLYLKIRNEISNGDLNAAETGDSSTII